MNTCPRCRATVHDGVSFCPACGTSMGSTGNLLPPQAPAPPLPYGVAQATSGKAVGSLVCGILSVIILPLFASIPAVILGHISLSEIRKSAGRLHGKGMAIAGLVMGYFSVAFIPFVLIIAAIAIPNLLRARMVANEASAAGILRAYDLALQTYAARCENIGFPASLQDLGPGTGGCQGGANLLDSALAEQGVVRNGYLFSYSPRTWDASGRAVSYGLTADPVTEGTTGRRHFFLDERRTIRCATGAPATADSPALP
jgi:type IV pilus assembly protein PilA